MIYTKKLHGSGCRESCGVIRIGNQPEKNAKSSENTQTSQECIFFPDFVLEYAIFTESFIVNICSQKFCEKTFTNPKSKRTLQYIISSVHFEHCHSIYKKYTVKVTSDS